MKLTTTKTNFDAMLHKALLIENSFAEYDEVDTDEDISLDELIDRELGDKPNTEVPYDEEETHQAPSPLSTAISSRYERIRAGLEPGEETGDRDIDTIDAEASRVLKDTTTQLKRRIPGKF